MIWILLLAANMINPISAQFISRYVIGGGGGMLTQELISLSATLGQHGFAGMLQSESLFVLSGFQQPDAMVSTPVQTSENMRIILAYPNPFADYFTLIITTNEFSEIHFKLYGPLGKVLWQRDRQTFDRSYQETISTQDLPSGMYHLQLYLSGGNGKNVQQYVVPLISTH